MKIIQFPHPGNEHVYSKVELASGLKNWNSNKCHARNFIRANGFYVDSNGKLNQDSLTFWGEWEAPANMFNLNYTSGTDMPRHIIEPHSVSSIKAPIPRQMNSDPLVFGKHFKYAICRQNQRSITMKNLCPGSIILFGCVRGTKFLLDTVFVVGDYKKQFSLSNANSLSDIDEFTEYKKLVLDTFFFKSFKNSSQKFCRLSVKEHKVINGCSCKNLTKINQSTLNTYYEGASFANPFKTPNGDIYSFVPAKVYDSNNLGFARLALDTKKDFKELHYKNLQNFYMVKDESASEIKAFWDRLCNATEKTGLVKAVCFPYP